MKIKLLLVALLMFGAAAAGFFFAKKSDKSSQVTSTAPVATPAASAGDLRDSGVAMASVPEPAPLQLKGVLNTASEKLFGLSTEAGDATAWVSLGKTFSGFSLKSYDEPKGLLFLERDGKTYELSLALAKIGAANAGKGTPATIADAATVIDKMRFEEMLTRTLEGQKKAMAANAKKMAQQMGRDVDPKELEEHQSKVMDAMLEAMNLPQMKEDMKKIYAETFSKEELAAMNDFYATSAGTAMIDKQPEVSEKLQALMMPRMMSAMPKIQQMSAEFGKQQKAKADAAKAAAAPAAAPAETK